MPIPIYLAMTAEEFAFCREKPTNVAWMACHFSPYGKGLTNLPPGSLKNAIVTVNDRIPWNGHDAAVIAAQLKGIDCGGILLDFQRPDTPLSFVSQLLAALPHPVCIAERFALDTECPILLPPVPPHIPVAEYIEPWQGREIWLEASQNTSQITVTAAGAEETMSVLAGTYPHKDAALSCHYGIAVENDRATFSFCRLRADMEDLATQAKDAGVTRMIGLYQELK